jgi:hypothetical protein
VGVMRAVAGCTTPSMLESECEPRALNSLVAGR